MATNSKRLAKLENRRGPISGLFFTLFAGESLTATAQAQMAIAMAHRQPVFVLRLAGYRDNPSLTHS